MILRLPGLQQCLLQRLGLIGNQGHNMNAGVNTLLWRGLKGKSNVCSADTDEGQERTARLVITHSSYLDGLVPLLDRFVEDPDASCSITTVVPGRMYSCNGRAELFKMSVRESTNGFKCLARKGTVGQEVFIGTTKMGIEGVKAALNRAAGFDLEKGGSRREQKMGRKR